ncbi:MAG: ribonuclease P protein component [Burkholderiaceae bacterium]|jgi:ribonuclease P protein component|nr:ribonuclease P protein component [Burkholderiaceae bacterium]
MATAWRRLCDHAQFQALLSTRPAARSAHFALHRWRHPVPCDGRFADAATPEMAALFAPPDAVWIGAMTPKRWARRAVTRNLMRRQIYAVFGQSAAALPAGAHLIRLRAGFDAVQFPSAASLALRRAVRGELLTLLTFALS